MFKKTNRLSQAEFSEYFSKGKRQHSKHLTTITFPHERLKVAVVVGKKVAKSAVRRNLLKRRVYAELREILSMKQHQGVLIVLAKPTLATLSRQSVREGVREAVAQALKSA